jgi:hypothetical protein
VVRVVLFFLSRNKSGQFKGWQLFVVVVPVVLLLSRNKSGQIKDR